MTNGRSLDSGFRIFTPYTGAFALIPSNEVPLLYWSPNGVRGVRSRSTEGWGLRTRGIKAWRLPCPVLRTGVPHSDPKKSDLKQPGGEEEKEPQRKKRYAGGHPARKVGRYSLRRVDDTGTEWSGDAIYFPLGLQLEAPHPLNRIICLPSRHQVRSMEIHPRNRARWECSVFQILARPPIPGTWIFIS